MLDSTNAEQRRQMVALLAARGIPTNKIAARLGVPVNVVRTDRVHLSTLQPPKPSEAKAEGKRKYYPMSREERLATNKIKLQPEMVAKRRAAVIELCAKKMTDTEIGKELGVTATTIARDRKRLGIAPLDFTEPTVIRRDKAKELLAKGVGIKEASRVLGVATTTVLKDYRSIAGKPVPQSVKAARNREVVRTMTADGASWKEICAALNISQTSLWRYKRTIAEEDAAS